MNDGMGRGAPLAQETPHRRPPIDDADELRLVNLLKGGVASSTDEAVMSRLRLLNWTMRMFMAAGLDGEGEPLEKDALLRLMREENEDFPLRVRLRVLISSKALREAASNGASTEPRYLIDKRRKYYKTLQRIIMRGVLDNAGYRAAFGKPATTSDADDGSPDPGIVPAIASSFSEHGAAALQSPTAHPSRMTIFRKKYGNRAKLPQSA